MPVSDNIKRLRLAHGLTQAQFAEIAGVSDKAVSTWEAGLKTPRERAVQRIAVYFNICESEVLYGAGAAELTEDERELLLLYRAANEEEKQRMLRYLRFLAGRA